MNIYFQVAGLTLLIYLLFLYRSHKTLDLYGERAFHHIIVFTFVNLTLDALSVLMIHFRASMPHTLVVISCKAYIISMIWLGMADFCYVMLDLKRSQQEHKRMILILMGVSFLASVVTAVLPIEIHADGMNVYTAGPSVMTVYGVTLFYILSTMYVAIHIRRHMNSRRGQAVIIATILWLIAAAVQFFNNQLLVVGFSSAIGVMILYIVMENPDANLDRQLSCFNSYALNQYLNKLLVGQEDFHVLDISIRNIRMLEGSGVDVQAKTKEVIRLLEKEAGLYLFKNFSYGLVLITQSTKKIEAVCDRIMNILYAEGDLYKDVLVIQVRNADRFGTPDDLLKFLTYVRSEHKDNLSSMLYVTDDMIGDYQKKKQIEIEINNALQEDRVEVFYQPLIGQPDEKRISAEALVRIRNKDGSLLSPGVFIPVSEETGQIKELGERVLEKVCKFLRDTDALALGLQSVDVNLSAVQCDDNTMAVRLSRIVDEHGVDPSRLIFEITETAVSSVRDTLLENMQAMTAKGYRFALDDFGKGESNLIYLVETPASILKLDIDMTKAYFRNEKARCVVQNVVRMVHQLNFTIVVEGVEDQKEAEQINAEGIDYIQGYYYSRPLPAMDFLEYLRKLSLERKAVENTPAPVSEPVSLSEAEEEEADFLAEKNVLLVEDNEINSEIVQDMLESILIHVDTAFDGMEAVKKVREKGTPFYDFILMDIRMPVMDGYEATRRIRELHLPGTDQVPIIALTASTSDEDKERALASGMNAYVTKPAGLQALISVMHQTMPGQ